MGKSDVEGGFLETFVALLVFGITRTLSVVCSILVVVSVFGLVLSAWRLAQVPSAGWVDWIVAAVSVAVLVCWLAIGRGSLEDKFESAACRWLSRWSGGREDEDPPN